MSQIILSKYKNGDPWVVVGWEGGLRTFFWNEYSVRPPDPPDGREIDWDAAFEAGWEEFISYGGADPEEIKTTQALRTLMPEDHRELLTSEVEAMLMRHSSDPTTAPLILDWNEFQEKKRNRKIKIQITKPEEE